MSIEELNILISKMHIKLNQIIENNNYNLQSEVVLDYSRKLDKVLIYYNRISKKSNTN